jgi:hypothetical protein
VTPTLSVEAVHANPMLVVEDDVTCRFDGGVGGWVSPELQASVLTGYQIASARSDLLPAASSASRASE